MNSFLRIRWRVLRKHNLTQLSVWMYWCLTKLIILAQHFDVTVSISSMCDVSCLGVLHQGLRVWTIYFPHWFCLDSTHDDGSIHHNGCWLMPYCHLLPVAYNTVIKNAVFGSCQTNCNWAHVSPLLICLSITGPRLLEGHSCFLRANTFSTPLKFNTKKQFPVSILPPDYLNTTTKPQSNLIPWNVKHLLKFKQMFSQCCIMPSIPFKVWNH